MTKIRLLVDHVHADTEYAAGTEIEVDASAAEWLTKNGHATIVAPTVPATKPQPKHAMSEEDN